MMDRSEPLSPRAWWKGVLVSAGVLGLAAAHFTADPHAEGVHAFLFKATFLPLVLAGLWFGLRGALTACGATVALYAAHIRWQLVPCGRHDLPAILLDLALIVSTSVLVGALSDRREHQRRTAVARAEELARATEGLLRAEEHLRRSERLRAMGELAAGMAHEVRNPLGGIRGAGEILAREDTTPAAREEFRAVLLQEIARLDRFVDGVLRFARPPEGAGAPQAERVDLAAALSGVLLLLQGEARRRGVRCRVEGAEGATWTGDPDLLRHVLLNLCLNALQAMPGGGALTLRVGRAPLRVDVEDEGGGIPPALLGRLCEPFVTGREGGTGLGLATAQRIAAALGGALRVARTGPSGTVMTVVLEPEA